MPLDSSSWPTRNKEVSVENKKKAGELVLEFQYLFGLRGNWNSHWTEIAERIYPMHAYLFQNYSQITQQGDKRNFAVYDSTGILALQRFGAILDSLLTPRNQFWHQLKPDDSTLRQDKSTRLWFDKANQLLFEHRYRPNGNFAAQNQLQYLSLGAYGTGILFVDRLDPRGGDKGIRYRNSHLGEIFLQENHQGIVDRCFRHFQMTARQMVQKFQDKCPQGVLAIVDQFPERQFFLIHAVVPNDDRDPYRKDFKGMKWSSFYVSEEHSEVVEEGGYREMPYIISRYTQAPNEAYGRSPAMDVLPALKTLNEQKKTMLMAGHRALDPVLLAHDDGVVASFNFQAGSINYGGVTSDGRPLVVPLPTGNLPDGRELMEDERKLIKDSFLVSLFDILTESPEMTATQVLERIKEKGILLAPTVGRQDSEYLGPLVIREMDLLKDQGLLPPMPKMLAQSKGQYKIVFDSPITRTQKSEWASGAVRAMEIFTNYSQATQDPSILDYIDMDHAAPQIADIYGMPQSWIRSSQAIADIRNHRAKQQATQTAIQAAPAVAGMAKAGMQIPGMQPQQGQPMQRKPRQR
jgi:head-to-tail connecting protein